jgi:natural product biosynthesis luciferase-like monooxygenase protein
MIAGLSSQRTKRELFMPNGSNQPMHFGLLYFSSGEETQHRDKYRLVLEGARFADRHDFAGVWVPERHFTPVGCLFPNPAVVQAAVARETSHIRLRAGSVVLPIHHPVRVAEEWSIVDNLSDGRVELSFASGWHPADFVLAPERYADRHEAMYRAMEVIRDLWRGGLYKAKGGDGKETEVRVYPTPVQKELPFWLTAAGNPKTFIRAGASGAHLLTHLFNQSLEETAGNISEYRKARAQAGYDPAAGRVALMIHTFIGSNLQEVQHQVREPFGNYLKSSGELLKAIALSQGQDLDFKSLSAQDQEFAVNFVFERLVESRVLFGTPESCLPLIQRLRAAGVDEVACQVDFGVPTDVILHNLLHLNRLREMSVNAAAARVAAAVPAAVDSGTANAPAESRAEGLAAVRARCTEELSEAEFYAELDKRGINCPARLHAVEGLRRSGAEVLARVRLPDALEAEAEDYRIHPAYLDSCFQVLLAAAPASAGGPFAPAGMRSLRIAARPGRRTWCHAVLRGPAGAGSTLEGDVRILDEEGNATVEVRGLRLQRIPGSGPPWERYADWFYAVSWESRPLPVGAAPTPATTGRWLIFADRQGVGLHLAGLLKARGDSCVLADAVECPGIKSDLWCHSEGFTEEIESFVKRNFGPGERPLTGIIHLWSLDGVSHTQTDAAALELAQRLGSDSVTHIIRALACQDSSSALLWMVTRGCQPVGPAAPLEVSQSPLWGLGRMFEVEHPKTWGGLVDLDPAASSADAAAQLLSALDGADREDQVAFRAGRRYVARLRRQKKAPKKACPLQVREGGAYLITGGLGGIGLKLADWLVHQGARKLVLVGRSALPERPEWRAIDQGHPQAAAIAAIQDLEARGAQVHVAAADVADEAQMSALLGELRKVGFAPLHGVFHAAGVGLDRPLAELDSGTLASVLRPKVAGTWLLHRLTADEPLDYFVLFSSVNSLLATQGQGSYAGANAFLDSLAHHRAAEGKPALCINWGPWGEVGFGATPQGVRQHALLALQGISRLAIKEGLEVLEVLLRQGPTQLGVIPIDWAKLLQVHTLAANWPLLAAVVEEEGGKKKAAPAKASRGFVAPRTDLERLMARMWQEVLKVDKVGIYDNFFELGGQSIQGAVLVNKLQERLGEVVHIVSLFDAPTIADLAVYLTDNYPRGIARVLAAEGLVSEAAPATETPLPQTEALERRRPLDDALLDHFRDIVHSATSRYKEVPPGAKNPTAIFILSPPRSGSTLLRVMLAGHSRLFAPPELELLSSPTLADRKATFGGRNSYRLQGTIRALMEIHGWETERAARMMDAWEAEGWSSQRFYRHLQDGAGGKILVDKTPSYGLDPTILARAEAWFDEPLYIHLTRHPYGMILSFEEAHMEALFAEVEHGMTPRQLAEANWTLTENNVRAFLADIPTQRQCHIRYEDLVSSPRETLGTVCRMAGLNFEEAMARPYQDKERRMTDGIQMFGDVKFHKHQDIDPAMADRWAERYTEDFLGNMTWDLAEAVGYPRGLGAGRKEPAGPAIARRPRAGQLQGQLGKASDAEVDNLLQSLLSKDIKRT